MNELIRQLALEAFQPINDITTEGVADRRTFDQAWFQHYNEKFAELVVRECAGLFPNVYVEIENEYGHTPVIAANYIKKHFGVK